MRNALLKSSALAALLIVSSAAYAQAPSDPDRNEPKNEKSQKAAPPAAREHERSAQPEQRRGAPEQKGAAEQSHQSSKPETNRAGTERPGNRNAAEENKKPPATTGQAAPQSPKSEQSEQNKGRDEQRKNAEDKKLQERNAQDKRRSEQKNGPGRTNAERSQQNKTKSTAAPPSQQQQQKGAATQEQPNKQPAAAQSNAPSGTTAQQQPNSSTAAGPNGQRNAATATNANQLAPQKQVQISETISRTHMAPPERNLNVSINIGTVVPSRVHFHPLPREIWSIEPQYRGYDYFTTEEDIVIIEPRTRRVVSMVPRDPSRARAQVTSTQVSSGGPSAQCQVMRRDPVSGQLSEVGPSTVGAGGSEAPLSVTVQVRGAEMSRPVALDAPAGQIVVATQGNGDCQITIEPETRR